VRRAGLATGLLLISVASVAACSGGHHAAPPTTSAPSTTAPSTTLADTATVQLPTVPGQTTLAPLAVSPGPASIGGTVVDDTGAPVGAATVSVQRVVGSRVAAAQVTSAPDGTWGVQGILGGAYRVRAWRAPDLAQPSATVVFVPATGTTPALTLTVDHYTGTSVQAAVSPNPPALGAPADLLVQVNSATVGTDGVVRQAPVAGAEVTIDATGDWSVAGPALEVTGANGQVVWQATCESPGPQPVAVTVNGGGSVGLSLPNCAAPPSTTTTSSSSTTSSTALTR